MAKKSSAEIQQQRKADGLCCSCSKKALPRRRRCQFHTDKAAEDARARYQARKRVGICSLCRKDPVEPGMSACRPCLDKQAESTASRREDYAPRLKELKRQYRDERTALNLCQMCGDKPPMLGLVHCEDCAEINRQRTRACWARLRDRVLAAYGNACVNCGETTREFLQVDHVNDDGKVHRDAVGYTGVFRDIVRRGFPPEFQILCVDCNADKRDQRLRKQHHAGIDDPDVPRTVKARRVRDVGRYAGIRELVFDHYGRSCACCGSTRVLHIDHIGGGGCAHRRELKKQGIRFYDWLVKNGLPAGYRTLCARCNWSIGRYG
jgi:hypothetical protein